MTILNISDNGVGDEAADDIAIVVSQNTQLQELHLHNNNFHATGAIKITKALKNTLTLAKYDILHNSIDRRAINILRDILAWNTKLNPCMIITLKCYTENTVVHS